MKLFNQIWERIKNETNVKTLTQLSEIVKSTQQYVSKKKKDNDFPVKWAYLVGQKYNLSTDWIMTGKGIKKFNEEIPWGKSKNIFLKQVHEWLQEITKSEPKREDWFQIEFEKSFPEFKKWVQQSETKGAGDGDINIDSKVA